MNSSPTNKSDKSDDLEEDLFDMDPHTSHTSPAQSLAGCSENSQVCLPPKLVKDKPTTTARPMSIFRTQLLQQRAASLASAAPVTQPHTGDIRLEDNSSSFFTIVEVPQTIEPRESGLTLALREAAEAAKVAGKQRSYSLGK